MIKSNSIYCCYDHEHAKTICAVASICAKSFGGVVAMSVMINLWW